MLFYNSRGLIQQENISTGDVTDRGVVQRLSSSSVHNSIQPSRKLLGAIQRRTNWNFSEIWTFAMQLGSIFFYLSSSKPTY